MSNIRDMVVEEALRVQNFRASDAYDIKGVAPYKKRSVDLGTGQLFRELLGPAGKGGAWDLSQPFSCRLVNGKYITKGVSTCGLCAAGIGRNAGIPWPWNGQYYWSFAAPYTGLDIVSCLSRIGQLTKSIRATNDAPMPGDFRCIGSGLSTHVFTIVGVSSSNIESVDGGAVDDAAHGYLQRLRYTKRPAVGMRVVWTINVEKLYDALTGYSPIVVESAWTVKDTQTALKSLGYYTGKIDGIAWKLTIAATVAFQKEVGLKPDGVVGTLTRAALRAAVGMN